MTVNKDIGGGFTATRAKISGGERIIRNEAGDITKINVNVCLYKGQAEMDAKDSCCETSVSITDVEGYDGSLAWLEAKVEAELS